MTNSRADNILQELSMSGRITFEELIGHEGISAQQALDTIIFLLDNHIIVDAFDGTFVLKGGARKITQSLSLRLASLLDGSSDDSSMAVQVNANDITEQECSTTTSEVVAEGSSSTTVEQDGVDEAVADLLDSMARYKAHQEYVTARKDGTLDDNYLPSFAYDIKISFMIGEQKYSANGGIESSPLELLQSLRDEGQLVELSAKKDGFPSLVMSHEPLGKDIYHFYWLSSGDKYNLAGDVPLCKCRHIDAMIKFKHIVIDVISLSIYDI